MSGQHLRRLASPRSWTRLGYIPHDAGRPARHVRRKGDTVDVFVREFRFSDEKQAAQQLRVGFDGEAIAALAGRERHRRARFSVSTRC